MKYPATRQMPSFSYSTDTSSLACLLPAACSTTANRSVSKEAAMIEPQRETVHRGSDDLLTAGLGLDGLRVMTPPAFADAANPTAEELRLIRDELDPAGDYTH